MSKRSLFWGNASGKLGEAVFYRAGGEQRTRTWVPKIKNPRTNAQAVQRCKLNNLTAFYKSADVFLKQVLQPEKSSMSTFNQFVKNNAKINPFVANKAMIDGKYSIPYLLSCSRGDLAIPTTYYNETGETTVDLSANGTDMGTTTAESPFQFTLANPLPEVEFEGTQSATAADQARGFLYGKEFYQVFAGNGNPYGLPAEFAVFIIVASYLDEGYGVNVLGVKCSADSNDQLHAIIQNGSNLMPVGNPAAYLMPINGTLTKGTASANMKLSGTTQYLLSNGSFSEISGMNDLFGICVAYRDDTGIHSSPCVLNGTQEFRTDTPNAWLPTGDVGREIVSAYETAANTIV